jgi:hypothetical protein
VPPDEFALIALVLLVLGAWKYYQDVYVRKIDFHRSGVLFFIGAALVCYPVIPFALPYFKTLQEQWDNGIGEYLALVIAGLIVVCIIMVLAYKTSMRKREKLSQIARRLGFTYDPDGHVPLPPGVRQVPILESLQTITHVLRSEGQEHECVLFQHDYSYGDSYRNQTVAAYHVSCSIPGFLLKPKTLIDRLSAALGGIDVDFPTHSSFSSVYRLVCSGQDEAIVRKLFANGLLTLFERERGWTLACRGQWVGMYKNHLLIVPHEIPNFHEWTKGIAKAIETAALSLVH